PEFTLPLQSLTYIHGDGSITLASLCNFASSPYFQARPQRYHMNASNAVLDIYVDGSCAPKNPGGTPVWGCFFLRNGVPVDTLAGLAAADASERATNNLAEYVAFINALKEAKRRGWDSDRIRVLTDSQLLHGQLAL